MSNLRCGKCNAPRSTPHCAKCGTETKRAAEGWEEPALPDIERIRELAHQVGYALGVHGTLERDLDLIAAPWVEGAVSAEELISYIAHGLGGHVVDSSVKPLGRIAANIQLDGWFKLIDISVCPIVKGTS